MQLSAEIRWFWRASAPARLLEWYRDARLHGGAPGGGGERVDEYLRETASDELGIKRRGDRPGIEVKGLVAGDVGRLDAAPFSGAIQLWSKWRSTALVLPPGSTIATRKQRWLRKFTAGAADEVALGADETPRGGQPFPTVGCNVELTRVTLPDGEIWWTFGFEAFGSLQTVERDLRATAALLASRRPPILVDGLESSYTAWLRRLAAGPTGR